MLGEFRSRVGFSVVGVSGMMLHRDHTEVGKFFKLSGDGRRASACLRFESRERQWSILKSTDNSAFDDEVAVHNPSTVERFLYSVPIPGWEDSRGITEQYDFRVTPFPTMTHDPPDANPGSMHHQIDQQIARAKARQRVLREECADFGGEIQMSFEAHIWMELRIVTERLRTLHEVRKIGTRRNRAER